MIKIGIDYSLISSAVCIYKDGEYSFIINIDEIKQQILNIL